ECDVPLRPGWFYHPEQDGKEKSAEEVFDLFLKSVGRGAALDLGLAPTPEGKLHSNDVEILKEFGEKMNASFSNNLLAHSQVKATKTRGSAFGVQNLTDDSKKTYWATKDGKHSSVLS